MEFRDRWRESIVSHPSTTSGALQRPRYAFQPDLDLIQGRRYEDVGRRGRN